MSVATFEGVVENGQVRLPKDAHVPDQTKVYIVVPDAPQAIGPRLRSPRLADPKQAKDFEMKVIPDANGISSTILTWGLTVRFCSGISSNDCSAPDFPVVERIVAQAIIGWRGIREYDSPLAG